MNLQIAISCDDICPKPGYRLIGEPAEKWFRELNDEFGAKFTCFIPANYHGTNLLSENKEWIQELNSISWIECAGHGFFHQCQDPTQFGEMEFFEMNSFKKIDDRMFRIFDEWLKCDVEITGWRNPGWMNSEMFNVWFNNNIFASSDNTHSVGQFRNKTLKYMALHYEHNRGMKWNCKTFFGHDGIHQTEIGIHNVSEDGETGMVMFQSHIAGNHNDNVWNQKNFDQLKLSLEHLVQTQNCEFKLLKECI